MTTRTILSPASAPIMATASKGWSPGLAGMEARWGSKGVHLPPEHPAWDLEAHYLALGLMNWICTLSPQLVIMGGGVMNQQHLFPAIRRELAGLLNGYIQHAAFVAPGQMAGGRSGVLGALLLAKQHLSGSAPTASPEQHTMLRRRSIVKNPFAAPSLLAAFALVFLGTCAGWAQAPAKAQPAAPKAGPTPRLANGKPDLSGFWRGPLLRNMDKNVQGGFNAILTPAGKAAYEFNKTKSVNPEGLCLFAGIPSAPASAAACLLKSSRAPTALRSSTS